MRFTAKSGRRVLADETIASWSHRFTGTALDVGSGPAARYQRLLPRVERWYGFDAVDGYSGLADAETLPVRAASMDVVAMMWMLHALRSPARALNEARRVLRPGGRLLLGTPFSFEYHPEPLDFWRFTEDGVRLLLADAGFTDVEVVPIGDRALTAVETLGPILGKVGLYRPALTVAVRCDRHLAGRTWSVPTVHVATAVAA